MELTQEQKFKFRLRAEQEAAASAPVEAKAPREKRSAIEAGIEGAGQGLTFGFGDELQAGLGAVADKVTSWLPGQTAGEMVEEMTGQKEGGFSNYRGLRDAERANQAQLREDNPAAFGGGEIVGSILNPSNAVGAGAAGAGLKGLGKLAGVGAAEGAAYGLGETEELDRQALVDTAGGATVGGLMAGGVGGLARTLGRKNIAKDLVDDAGNFTPINLAAKPGEKGEILGEGYREVVKRTYGGGEQLKKQGAPTLKAADDALESAQSVLKGTEKGEKMLLEKAVAKANTDSAERAIMEAIPDAMDKATRAKVAKASSAVDKEQIISKWWAKDGFQSVKGLKEINVPDNLVASVKSTIKRNPEFSEIITPAMMDGFEDLAGSPLSGRQFMEVRNQFARAANKTPSMKGKGARAFAKKFDNIIKKELGAESDGWKQYKNELSKWGGKQGLTKSAKAARKRGEDITAADVTRAATDASKLQKASGLNLALQKEAKKKMTKAALSENPNVQRAAEDLSTAKESVSELKSLAGAENTTPISKLITTALVGGPLGAAALGTKGVQKTLAGQTALQTALRKSLEEGNMDEYIRIMARMNSAAQTGE